MDQIDISSVEKLFASSGSRLYSIAETTVRDESMLDLLSSGVVVGLSGGADSVFLLCFLLLFSVICKASSDNPFAFLHFFFSGMVWSIPPVQCYEPPFIVLHSLSDLIP